MELGAGFSLLTGSPWHGTPGAGPWWDTERSRRRLCPVPSGAGGCLCLRLPALRVPGCCPGGGRGQRRPLPSPGAVSGDPGLVVWGHAVRTSRPVRSAEAVALMVPRASRTPSEGPKWGTWSRWAPGLARQDPHGSARATTGRAVSMPLASPRRSPGAKAAGLLSPWTGAPEVAMLWLLLVPLHRSSRAAALRPSPGCGTVRAGARGHRRPLRRRPQGGILT